MSKAHLTSSNILPVETTRRVVSRLEDTQNNTVVNGRDRSNELAADVHLTPQPLSQRERGVNSSCNGIYKDVPPARLNDDNSSAVSSEGVPSGQTGVWETDEINNTINLPVETTRRVVSKPEKAQNDSVVNSNGRSNELNIGLFGFGCVGKGLYDVLNHSQGLKAGITKICVKDRSKPRPIAAENFTFQKNEVLQNDDHDLIVELIDDSDAALEIITDSLLKGRDVVTAGKKVVAENFGLLYSLQQQTGASLLYEAACAGSIPIIRTLEEYYDNELLSSVKGILNGSSNYILTKMELEKLSYEDALKQAQAAGFAESDPSLDVNGTDAKYKLCLLAAHAFGIILKPADVFNSGIHNISEFDINYAAQNNLRIKLIAEIRKTPQGFRAYVLPRFIPQHEPLAGINYEFNGIEVEGVYSDKQLFTGKGAGSHPTGSAVLSDISAITYNYRYGYKKLKKHLHLTPQPLSYEERGAKSDNFRIISPLSFQERGSGGEVGTTTPQTNFTLRLYIRYSAPGELAGLDIRQIHEEYRSARGSYIVADVGFKSLRKLNEEGSKLFVCEV